MDAKQPYNNFYDCVTEKSFFHKKKLYLRGYKMNLIHLLTIFLPMTLKKV